MHKLLDLVSVNGVLLLTILVTLIIWVIQEFVGRRFRINVLCTRAQQSISLGHEAGFPVWLRVLSGLLVFVWIFLGLVIYMKRDGDFSLILVSLVLLSGVVSLIDSLVFRQRRIQLMSAAPVQNVLSHVHSDDQRQSLINWAETDFVAAEYARSFFPVLLVVLVLRSFFLEPFKIPSASMVPTLQVHDFILVNKFAYGLRLPVLGTKVFPVGMPERGDVMVFFPPNDARYFIKRVVGLPGDQIRLEANVLYINGVMMNQTLLEADNSRSPPVLVMQEDMQPHVHTIQYWGLPTAQSSFQAVVPEDSYFMLGDNRDNSSDSRFWGMVPEENVVGKAVYVWMHWESFFQLPSFSRNGVIR